MALDKTVKENALEETRAPDHVKNVPEEPKNADMVFSVDEAASEETVTPAAGEKTCQPEVQAPDEFSQIQAALQSLDAKIESMKERIEELDEEIKTARTFQTNTVCSKIDRTKKDLETVIADAGMAKEDTGPQELRDRIAGLEQVIQDIGGKQDRNNRNLVQTLRENADFQIQVRQGMQKELEALRKEQAGEQFNPILKEVASIYCDYQNVLKDETISELTMKSLRNLFGQLEDLLADYDAEIIRSREGDVRNLRSAKLVNKVYTGEQGKHNTVSLSIKPGVMRGRTVLASELIDVYVYDPKLASDTMEEETKDLPVRGEDDRVQENSCTPENNDDNEVTDAEKAIQ